MFTGIVERRGDVVAVNDRPGGRELTIAPDAGRGLPPWGPVAVGESIAVSGVCLTATRVGPGGAELGFDVVPESLSRTTLGRLRRGDRVNLERSLAVGDRMGGHFVTGHVDGVGQVIERRVEGDQALFRIRAPAEVILHSIPKGSVAVEGVALTVIEVDRAASWFSFAAIPHTIEATTLGERRPGDPVNLEADALGKWVIHGLREVLGRSAPPAPGPGGNPAP